jgi:hypothetical protein
MDDGDVSGGEEYAELVSRILFMGTMLRRRSTLTRKIMLHWIP